MSELTADQKRAVLARVERLLDTPGVSVSESRGERPKSLFDESGDFTEAAAGGWVEYEHDGSWCVTITVPPQ